MNCPLSPQRTFIILILSVGQDFRNSLAGTSSVESHEITVKMSAGAVSPKGLIGASR